MNRKKLGIIISVLILGGVAISFTLPEFRNTIKKRVQKLVPDVVADQMGATGSDEGYSAILKKENIEFQIIPQPAEKRLFLLKRNKNLSAQELAEANKMICYELRIKDSENRSILNLPSHLSHQQKVDYFSAKLGKRITMVVNQDTLPCLMYHLEQNFGVAPYQSIQLGFPYEKKWKGKSHHIIIKDDFFGFGNIHLVSTY